MANGNAVGGQGILRLASWRCKAAVKRCVATHRVGYDRVMSERDKKRGESDADPKSSADPKRTRLGRPTLLTPAIQDRIVKALLAGNFRRPAVKWAGVGYRTFLTWMERGLDEQPGQIHCDFRRAVEEAECTAEILAVARIMEAGKADVNHYKWYLERKHWQRWGKKDATRLIAAMSPGERAAVLKVLLVGTPPPGEQPFDPNKA